MVEVKANLAVTSVTIVLSEVDASRLRAILQGTILWQDAGVLGALAADIDSSLDVLDIHTSPVQLRYDVAHGMFVEQLP